jgi:LytR cell envelope-related transcriptional attenuator/helix-turn-helix protein
VNHEAVNAVRVLEVESGPSPLEAARTGRSLTREEAAATAALSVDEIAWLEEGRLYRFRSAHLAVAAVATYAAALGVDHREALELAGRPVPPRPSKATRPRLVVGAACVVVLLALLTAIVVGPRLTGGGGDQVGSAKLPPTWRVTVDVLNGSGDVNYTRQVADRIGALAYQLGPIRRADTFKYEETAVYYPRHAQALADRLAKSLCVGTKPLPGGKDRRRLVVIVGPPSVGGC